MFSVLGSVCIFQAIDVFWVAGQLVVVVAWHDRDRYLAAGFLELLEESRLLLDQCLEFLRALERGELPQSEGVSVNDQLGVLLSFDLLQELDQLDLEVAVLELTVSPDVHITDKELFWSNCAHLLTKIQTTLKALCCAFLCSRITLHSGDLIPLGVAGRPVADVHQPGQTHPEPLPPR